MSPDVVQALQDFHANSLLAANDLKTNIAYMSAQLSNNEAQRKKLSCVAGHTECPTCGGVLKDVTPLITDIDATMKDLQARLKTDKAQLAKLELEINKATQTLASDNTTRRQIEQLEALVCDVQPYDAESHKGIQEAIVKLNGLMTQKIKYKNELSLNENNRANAVNTLNALPVFKSAAFAIPEDLIQWNNTSIAAHNANVASDRQLRLEIQKATLAIEQIDRELKQSEANKTLNVKRKAYTDGLQKMYDVLHPSQFAAMLIKTYASTLETKLHKYLSQFNFKYTVKVNDEFNIIVSNEDGDVLPKVSGGQAMVIGLSLRLALHDMFSQSLSMFCCDEPTQGLDTEKQALLFELVENLKQSGIQQVIIIDHNTSLARVVDNCINL
jgi:DNA repair exonuclease SbcCD ATPase subunit